MNHFNLIDEPWIPARLLNGDRVEFGVRNTLLQSREIAAIEDPSPLVVAALHRFLLAVLYRALEGPSSLEQARTLFRQGLPGARIGAYLDTWQERFWLFHEKYPFAQVPDFEPKEWRAWTVLAAEANADNAKVLFDHVNVQVPGQISPAAAARWILATQTFALGGGNSPLGYTKTAPAATGIMVLPLGHGLHDTLIMSLVPQNPAVFVEDKPIWEREPDALSALHSNPSRPLQGNADRYTWRTRTVRLGLGPMGSVRRVAFASGIEAVEGGSGDPMVAYRIDPKHGLLPIQFQERGLWRDFDTLLPDPKGTGNAPMVLLHATELARRSPERFPRVTLVLGQANDQAKIEFWRMERFELPEALASEKDLRAEIRSLLDRAEQAQHSLWLACSRFARDLIGHGNRDPDRKDVRAFLGQMVAIPLYWSILETRFHELLHAYTLDRSESEIRRLWVESIRDAVRRAWEQHEDSVVAGDAWAIRALVKAEGPIRQEIHKLNQEIAALTPTLKEENA